MLMLEARESECGHHYLEQQHRYINEGEQWALDDKTTLILTARQ
jgi:hypothetical protein